MKRFTKSILFVGFACFVAGNCTAFAQKHSGRSGGSSSFKSSGSGFSIGKQSSGNLGRSTTGSGNTFGGKGSPSGSFNGMSSRGSGVTFRPSNSGTPSLGHNIKPGSTSGRVTGTGTRLPGFGGTSGLLPATGNQRPSFGNLPTIGRGTSIPSIKPTPQFQTPQINLPNLPGNGSVTTVPFFSKGSSSLGSSSPGTASLGTASLGAASSGIAILGTASPGSTGAGHPNWKHALQHVLTHNKHHWCHTRPVTCHWWTQYCEPIAHCHHNEVVVCDWNRVQCLTVVYVGVPAQEVQWYLGMQGILLPGKGIGIDAVEPNSPAEQIGLQPGMVLTVCNGIALVDETSMQEAIRISGGVLQMTLLSADGSQVLEGIVQMAQVASVRF